MAISFEGAHFPKEIISAWRPQRPAAFLGGAGDFDVGVQAVSDTLIDGGELGFQSCVESLQRVLDRCQQERGTNLSCATLPLCPATVRH